MFSSFHLPMLLKVPGLWANFQLKTSHDDERNRFKGITYWLMAIPIAIIGLFTWPYFHFQCWLYTNPLAQTVLIYLRETLEQLYAEKYLNGPPPDWHHHVCLFLALALVATGLYQCFEQRRDIAANLLIPAIEGDGPVEHSLYDAVDALFTGDVD